MGPVGPPARGGASHTRALFRAPHARTRRPRPVPPAPPPLARSPPTHPPTHPPTRAAGGGGGVGCLLWWLLRAVAGARGNGCGLVCGAWALVWRRRVAAQWWASIFAALCASALRPSRSPFCSLRSLSLTLSLPLGRRRRQRRGRAALLGGGRTPPSVMPIDSPHEPASGGNENSPGGALPRSPLAHVGVQGRHHLSGLHSWPTAAECCALLACLPLLPGLGAPCPARRSPHTPVPATAPGRFGGGGGGGGGGRLAGPPPHTRSLSLPPLSLALLSRPLSPGCRGHPHRTPRTTPRRPPPGGGCSVAGGGGARAGVASTETAAGGGGRGARSPVWAGRAALG